MNSFERFYAFMTKPLVILSYFVLIVLSFCYLDQPIAYFFYHLNLRVNFPLLNWITHAGLGGIYLSLFLLMALYFRFIRPNKTWELRSWFLWFCIVIPSIVCTLLKIGLSRARPDLLFKKQIYGFYGFHLNAEFWSFPSGHATTVMGVFLGLCVLFPRHLTSLLILGIILASSRVLLFHHYLSDVLIASYLVLIQVGLIQYYLKKRGWNLTCESKCAQNNAPLYNL
ncbi:phosphatidylglycerophosphatase B [Legionella adelaidensis]|uniref:Phosphatidylglycerophosphatase B n=1 Tax=Legionella adelaidensis TaxID=45056 RepID=A0A0W0R4U1_9GAMM|nr:phosphatase PAP2 family protein [Legionella adelaidensis]KTC66097.1 phosphatidylglycerophosphatase B [Legionella adelaidensis]